MKFNIRGSKVKITEPIKKYIEEKIGKLDKYFENPNEITANVVARVRGKDQIIEVTVQATKLKLRGEESHTDLYAAIDLVLEKIERQIRKNKSRIKKNSRKSAVDILTNFETNKEDIDDTNKIVKRKVIDTKPMNEEEAILQMNLLGHEFFAFMDETTQAMSVIYRRKDGAYGILETK